VSKQLTCAVEHSVVVTTPYQVGLLCQNGETQGSGDNEKKTDVEFYSAMLIKLRRVELSRIDKRG
jgi:hypothetical protein